MTIEGGIIARSPIRLSQRINATAVAPAPQNKPITIELFHGYTFTPYCKASRNIIEAGANKTNPMRSSSGIVLRRSDSVNGAFMIKSGTLRKRSMTATTAPTGRLLKKPKTDYHYCSSIFM